MTFFLNSLCFILHTYTSKRSQFEIIFIHIVLLILTNLNYLKIIVIIGNKLLLLLILLVFI